MTMIKYHQSLFCFKMKRVCVWVLFIT